MENASDDFPQQKKLENLLPNFAGSSPPISLKTSPTSLWKSLVLRIALQAHRIRIHVHLRCVWMRFLRGTPLRSTPFTTIPVLRTKSILEMRATFEAKQIASSDA